MAASCLAHLCAPAKLSTPLRQLPSTACPYPLHPPAVARHALPSPSPHSTTIHHPDQESSDPQGASIAAMAAIASMLLHSQDACAIDGEYGILEGRGASLIHPVVMGGLFLYTLWAGYLGWQWRRVRTIQDEINALKKEVKIKEEDTPPSPVEIKIQELTKIRKQLLKGGYRDRHFDAGSILLAFGISEAVGGCFNTWLRTGKLFPGPHLFAGAAITVLWAAAAALVPSMQKGSETARSLHIGLNFLNVVLFLSQIPTGWDITLKVLQFTKWP